MSVCLQKGDQNTVVPPSVSKFGAENLANVDFGRFELPGLPWMSSQGRLVKRLNPPAPYVPTRANVPLK